MNRTLLVALRDYRQILSTRGFWMTLMIVPLAIAVSILAARLVGPPTTSAYVIVDATGQYAQAIERRIDLNHQRQVLADLSAYAQRWKVASAAPNAVWAGGRGWFSDPEVEAFVAAGGAPAALSQITPHLPAGAPAFKPSAQPFLLIPPPAGVPTDRGPDRFGAALTPLFKGNVETPMGKRPLALAIYIPQTFGQPGAPVRMWTNGRSNTALIETVRTQLTGAARLRALEANGLSAGAAQAIETLNVPLDVTAPPTGGGRTDVIIRSAIPLALVYLLLITAMTTGSMMLQGVIEERSNKLLESVLACIRPSELMYGKLLGLGAVGLTIVAVWVGCALGAAFSVQGVVADFLRPSLSSLDQPWMVGALIFYFMSGYLIVSMVFLAIGSLCNSMQDAQAYLTPVIMVIMLPVVLMMDQALLNPDAPLPRIMSWVPVYTPFAMLARLGGGVSLVEVLGTGVLLAAFLVLEVFLLGRVFQASLLSTGQPPKLAAFAKLMFQTPAD